MPNVLTRSHGPSDTDLFLRLWDSQPMTPTLARHLLKLDFAKADKARMHELAAMNRASTISDKEMEELDNYIRVGTLLSILQSRARKLLKHRNGNGRG